MKTIKYIKTKISLAMGVLLLATMGCERDLSEFAVPATFPGLAEVYTDAPVNLTDEFFISFNPAEGANPNGFGTDDNVAYQGNSSIRIDVPGVDDPNGTFIGGIFRDRGDGRNLTGYDALTFWAKGSTTATVGLFGFGTDFIENKYAVGLTDVALSTDWRKYTIPIPDASKLVQEKGMFIFSAGTDSTGGLGYTFWIDEIRFEKLGTIAQPRPAIMNGADVNMQTFNGAVAVVDGLTETFNLASGHDVTVNVAPLYYTFTSSNTAIATVVEIGAAVVNSSGTTTITASLNGMDAAGSLTLESLGDYTNAPTPTRNAANVISIFSDAYTNVPVDYYNGFWQPFQTTGSADFVVNGDNVLNYTNFNFVGTSFSNPTVNASSMTHAHFDIFIPGTIAPGAQMKITIRDFGADGVDGGGDDTNLETTLTTTTLVGDAWNSIDIPLTMANKNSLGLIIYENLGTNLTNFYADNIYFYEVPTTPTTAAPDPTLPAANVISLFSNVYTDVNVDTWRTSWSTAATVFTDVMIAGNDTKKYENLGVVGIETTSNTIDASTMTHIHMDVWSPDFTSFSIKLVDFGANNAFGGGDDTEHEISINAPAQGQWVSLDIPLSDFTNLTSRANIAQYILVGQPFEVTDVFIDNIYFHN